MLTIPLEWLALRADRGRVSLQSLITLLPSCSGVQQYSARAMQLTDYAKLTCSAECSFKAEPIASCEAHIATQCLQSFTSDFQPLS